jgi:surface polysaccharide O-acyltransferase-like enzyme
MSSRSLGLYLLHPFFQKGALIIVENIESKIKKISYFAPPTTITVSVLTIIMCYLFMDKFLINKKLRNVLNY